MFYTVQIVFWSYFITYCNKDLQKIQTMYSLTKNKLSSNGVTKPWMYKFCTPYNTYKLIQIIHLNNFAEQNRLKVLKLFSLPWPVNYVIRPTRWVCDKLYSCFFKPALNVCAIGEGKGFYILHIEKFNNRVHSLQMMVLVFSSNGDYIKAKCKFSLL